jgi:hypothetical protein
LQRRGRVVIALAAVLASTLVVVSVTGSATDRPQSNTCSRVNPRASSDTVNDVMRAVRRVVPRMHLGIDTRNFSVEYVAALRNDFGVAARVRKSVAARCGARFASFAWGVGVYFPRAPAASVGPFEFAIVHTRGGWRPAPLR